MLKWPALGKETPTRIDKPYEQAMAVLDAVDDKAAYIHDSLIPRMDERRGRESHLGRLEIVKKVFDVFPKKPSEAYELIAGELADKGFDLTSTLASEVADIVYYTSQPNCPEYMRDPSPLFESLGISMELANSFCILKYETRLNFGDSEEYKGIENKVIERFLSSLE